MFFNHFFKYKTEMKYSLIAILLFSFTALQAQVKGTVKDNLGDPIAGANLFWQRTTQGTTTSADGTFSLSKPNDKHMLVVSFIGFENDTIHVSNRNETLDIVLREGVELSEVNVVSRKLGTMKLRNSVMNEDMISSAELSRAACCNLGESFVTNPSVDVTYSDAATGAKQIKLLGLSGTYVQMMTENIPNYRGSAAPYGLGYVPGPWMQSIQVSKGSSSVKNGYEAITGQINVEFKCIEKLHTMYDLGVRISTLTWNFPNELGFPNPAQEEGKPYLPDLENGLTPTGITFVEEMERLGIVIDLSHLNDAGIRDVFAHTRGPVIASHSNARGACFHLRNLSDEMIRQLAERGGVTGINFCPSFLREEPAAKKASTMDMVRHMKYLRNVGGIDIIGLGTDFDGFSGETDVPDTAHMQHLADVMSHDGFTDEEIEKVFSKNVLRVFRECWK